MSEVNLFSNLDKSIEMEISEHDIITCCALSMDKRIDDIVNLISDIQELLGLHTDKSERLQRLAYFRQQAIERNIDPTLDSKVTVEVGQYCQLLLQKKKILQDIFDCCEEFYMQMRGELDALNSRFAEDGKARTDFVCNYANKSVSKPYASSPSTTTIKKQRRNRLPSTALDILWDFVRTHKSNPYPTTQQKENLARQTNLTLTQIRNWFTNTRKRKLLQSQESDEEYQTESDYSDSYHDSPSSSDSHIQKKRGRKKRSSYRSRGTLEVLKSEPAQSPDNGSLSKVTKNPEGTWIQFMPSFDNSSVCNSHPNIESGKNTHTEEYSLTEYDNYIGSTIAFDISNLKLEHPEQNEFFLNNNVVSHVKKESYTTKESAETQV